MGIARALDRILRKHFNMHAAWVPGVTAFRLGDYGLWRSGVFVPLGNVREFGVEIQALEGQPGRLDFVSEDARVTAFSAGVQVPVLPTDDSAAALSIELPRERSFILKCPALRSRRIANIAEVVRSLHAAYRRGGAGRWRLRYKVVGELMIADDLTLLATRERGTTITLRGQARLVRGFNSASVDAALGVDADHQLALDLRGASGPVGLGLFRVNVRGIGALNFSSASRGPVDVDGDSLALLVAEDRWDEDPEDDPEGDPDDDPDGSEDDGHGAP